MKTVFGFIENHRLRPVYDVVGDFVAAVSRQTVHEESILVRQAHQIGVDPVGFQGLAPVLHVGFFFQLPGVGDDEVGILDGHQRILAEADIGSGLLDVGQKALVRAILVRAGDRKAVAEQF